MAVKPFTLITDRLLIRPTIEADVIRAFEIQNQRDVSWMLRMASYPPDLDALQTWFCEHPNEWSDGTAYRFAIELDGYVIGIVDIDEISNHCGELGYWLDQSYWGKGYATEVADVVVQFAFKKLGISLLISGHAMDNPASGRILQKIGFKPTRREWQHYLSRGGKRVQHQSYVLMETDYYQLNSEKNIDEGNDAT